MRLPFPFALDPASFLIGFITASVFWWIVARTRPLWKEIRENLKHRQEATQISHVSSVEENHRRDTLRRAQGMHLATTLFALDEILQEPRLLAPPPRVEPGGAIATEDTVTLTLPYMPAWPELAAVYDAPTLSLGEALSGGMNLVIIGQPGTGKTVALAHLATLAANRSEDLGTLKDAVPFLIHVADMKLPVHDTKDLLARIVDMISEHTSMLDLGRVPGFVQQAFRSGRALLLLDGFDELTPEGQRTVSEYLKLLLEEYPNCRVVTTGAPEHLEGLLSLHFAPLILAAWNRQKQASFIQKWGEQWTQFISVESWAQTAQPIDPLLLNIWLNTENKGLTPFELTLKVWGAYAGDLLGPHILEAIASHIRRLAPSNTPLAALEALAMQVTLTAQPIFDPRKARDWVKSFEPPEEIDRVEEREPASKESEADETESESQEPAETEDSEKKKKPAKRRHGRAPSPTPGLLGRMATTGLVVAHANDRMRFVHPVIGGFLAGRALSGFKVDETLLNQPDWPGKFLAMRYLAAHGNVSSMVNNLLEWSRLPMHRPMLTAARWLRDTSHAAPWRGKVMAALAELMQTEGVPMALRGQAMAALATSNDPAVATLFRQFESTLSFELMKLAALGSGALGDAKAVPALENMLQAPSVSARQAACLALVAIGTTRALETVAQTLLNADEDTRRAAAEALASEPKEGHAMLKDGATMQDILLRHAVVYGLARVNESWATELLQKMKVEDDQWVVRNSASEALDSKKHIDDPRVPRPLKTPSETPWLIEFASTQGVGIAPGSAATDLLLSALKSEKEEERLGALVHLKQNPNDGIVKQIYEAMYADDPELREAAYLTLWEIGAAGYKLPHPSQFGFN